MYGIGDAEADFDSRGYNIPEQLQSWYVGQKALSEKVDSLSEKIDIVDAEYQDVLEKFGITREVYEAGKVRSNTLYATMSPIIERYNDLVEEFGPLVDEYNCYPNVSDVL